MLRLGTRGSPLAISQSIWVAQKLSFLGVFVEIIPFVTEGDRFLSGPLRDLGGKSLFTKEIEEALLKRDIDLAVHSLKDVSTALPEGLILGAIPQRSDVRDAWVCPKNLPIETSGLSVGTASLRRHVQLKERFSHLNVQNIRGNINTRLQKAFQGKVDGLILAVSGLKRLNWTKYITKILSVDQMLPAIGQGALAVECRQDDASLLAILKNLHHTPTALCTTLERGFLRALEGNCKTPVGGYAHYHGDQVIFQGLLATGSGDKISRISAMFHPSLHGCPEEFGWQKGLELLKSHNQDLPTSLNEFPIAY